MIGCPEKCGQNYPEKDQRRENETWVKNFYAGLVLIHLRACLHGGGGP